MPTGPATIRFLLDQLSGAGNVAARPMFGEYGLYCDGKVVGLVCDDTVFLKPTPGALALVASPRYGAKPYLVIEDQIDDPEAFVRLVRAVATDLPEPKPKKARAPRQPKG